MLWYYHLPYLAYEGIMQSKRMTAEGFIYFCENFSIDSFHKVSVHTNRFELFKSEKGIKSKTNKRFGPHLGPIMDWLDENLEHPYYVKRSDAQPFVNYDTSGGNSSLLNLVVDFYFVDEHDAMLFKLMFYDL